MKKSKARRVARDIFSIFWLIAISLLIVYFSIWHDSETLYQDQTGSALIIIAGLCVLVFPIAIVMKRVEHINRMEKISTPVENHKQNVHVFNPDFALFQIYEMMPTKQSHEKKPYFVEIIDVGYEYIITNIPGHRQLTITKHGPHPNWEYQTKRMRYIGTKNEFGYLLENQKLKS